MEMNRELVDWLRQSRVGMSLYTHLPRDCREQHCHLCDLPLDAMNEHMPCLHWLVAPYAKEERIRRVLGHYQASDAMRYLVTWALAQARKPTANNLACTAGVDSVDIRLHCKRRDWRLQLTGEHAAIFEYANRRTAAGFALPLVLVEGEAAALRELARFGANGASVWEPERTLGSWTTPHIAYPGFPAFAM